MALEIVENVVALVNSLAFRIGTVLTSALGATVTASTPIYVDSNSKLASGGFPFAVPMIAGATSTIASVASVEGFSTGSANELMHLTLVQGSNVTTFTSQGFMRVSVTDDAGNISNGSYYIQFGTLS